MLSMIFVVSTENEALTTNMAFSSEISFPEIDSAYIVLSDDVSGS